jgi:hypothetical protein
MAEVRVSDVMTIPARLSGIKDDWDWISARVPANWQKPIEFIRRLAGRYYSAPKWSEKVQEAATIWGNWEVLYNLFAANLPVAYPANYERNLSADRASMTACKTAFAAVHDDIWARIQEGLPALKKKLAYQWYLVENRVIDGATDAFYAAEPNESVDQFQARFKALTDRWVKPGKATWLRVVGFTNGNHNCYVHRINELMPAPAFNPQLAQEKRVVHFTVFKDQLTDLDTLKVTANIAVIKDAVLTPGTANRRDIAVHATWEYYGPVDERNPHVFGRPAGFYSKFGNYAGWFHDKEALAGILDRETARLEGLIVGFVNARLGCLRDGWNNNL